jgi:nucleoside-diphosphate-sugar epimerase
MSKPGFGFRGRAVVTGGSGFVGQRLCEMLLERGAAHVVSFDVQDAPPDALDDPRIQYIKGDLRDAKTVSDAVANADCVWHIAAAVGPYHPKQLYVDVNLGGTQNIIAACREHGVGKLVMSSSPSTRFDGSDVDGLTEAEMPALPQKSYLAEYARTKALGELAVTAACSPELLTVSVAPHQVLARACAAS